MPRGSTKSFPILRSPFVIQAALLIAALSLFFVDLGGSAIWDANEAFYVETPREMM
jgi:4-amino-4-deoxy-L-arabinose transferase-like glycosyltransferase